MLMKWKWRLHVPARVAAAAASLAAVGAVLAAHGKWH
jgi:hypothetical protein